MAQRIVKLGGIFCSKCRRLLAKPTDVGSAEMRAKTPCWCPEHIPSDRDATALRSIDGRVLGYVTPPRATPISNLSPEQYESAMLELCDREFLPLGHRVEGTRGGKKFEFPGRHSKTPRQLDAAVFRENEDAPFLVCEAHRYSKPIDVKDVDAFVGMLGDVGASIGILVCPRGYSEAAELRAAAAEVRCIVVTVEGALRLNLLAESRRIFPFDWTFHEDMADALAALRDDLPADDFIEALAPVPYDEWERLVRFSLSKYRAAAIKALHHIATSHYDDGWRYNAVDALDEYGLLTDEEVVDFAYAETNHENRELFLELIHDRNREILINTAIGHTDDVWRYHILEFLSRMGALPVEKISALLAATLTPEIRDFLNELLDEETP